MPFRIVRQDITRMHADAVVNTANPYPIYSDGTDRAIYEKAGAEELLKLRRKIGNLKPGQSAATPGLALPAQYIIHTVGPVWIDGKQEEEKILKKAYRSALELAKRKHCKSIAFPLMASGSNGFPKDRALSIALGCFREFLRENDMEIFLAVFDRKALSLSCEIEADIESYIDDHYVEEQRASEYRISNRFEQRRREQPGNQRSAQDLKENTHFEGGDRIQRYGALFKDFFSKASRSKQSSLPDSPHCEEEVFFGEQANSFEEHAEAYDEYAEALEEHAEAYDEYAEALEEHAETFEKHAEALEEHAETLEEHAEALEDSVYEEKPWAPTTAFPKAASPVEKAVLPCDSRTSQTFGGLNPSGRGPAKSLEERLAHTEETFQQSLFQIIQERGMKNVDVYTRANLDKKLFSKIKSNVDYNPKKSTALALCVGLMLTVEEAERLLRRAGYTFSPSSKVDVIVQYFLEKKAFDVMTIDAVLYEHDLPLLSGY